MNKVAHSKSISIRTGTPRRSAGVKRKSATATGAPMTAAASLSAKLVRLKARVARSGRALAAALAARKRRVVTVTAPPGRALVVPGWSVRQEPVRAGLARYVFRKASIAGAGRVSR